MENLLKISQLPLFYSVLTLLNVLKLESNLFVEQDHIVISINDCYQKNLLLITCFEFLCAFV